MPYRAGNMQFATQYEEILTRSTGVLLREIDRGQVRAAAQLRAVAGVRTPDARVRSVPPMLLTHGARQGSFLARPAG